MGIVAASSGSETDNLAVTEALMATRTAALESGVAGGEAASHWRTPTVALVLLMAIGAYFWTVSRYPALYKKYSQGTQV